MFQILILCIFSSYDRNQSVSKIKTHGFTCKFEYCFWIYFIRFWNFSNLFRPFPLPFCEIERNCWARMIHYLKDYLVLMGDFGFAIPWIMLPSTVKFWESNLKDFFDPSPTSSPNTCPLFLTLWGYPYFTQPFTDNQMTQTFPHCNELWVMPLGIGVWKVQHTILEIRHNYQVRSLGKIKVFR